MRDDIEILRRSSDHTNQKIRIHGQREKPQAYTRPPTGTLLTIFLNPAFLKSTTITHPVALCSSPPSPLFCLIKSTSRKHLLVISAHHQAQALILSLPSLVGSFLSDRSERTAMGRSRGSVCAG